MRAAIFIGPSLPRAAPWPAVVERLPPAALGDVYRLAARAEPPAIIGIVDGYFERRPPVRHAEILWALSQGIRVIGAASIGALRAAELAAHGMDGVGAIFEGYRDGMLFGEPLEADDEVAVSHGPAELGHPPLTLALVDLRASLAAAAAAGLVSTPERRAVVDRVRAQHFKDRSHASALSALPASRQAALQAWLQRSGPPLKQQDAALLIERVARLLGDPGAPGPAPRFRVTDSWLDFVEWAGGSSGETGAELLIALALDPALRSQVLRQALLRLLAEREAARRARSGDSVEALLHLFSPSLIRRLDHALADIGLRGSVDQGIRRRRKGREALDSGATPASAGELLRGHFQRLGTAIPADLEGYARSLGLGRAEQLLRALAEEAAAARLPG